jgi:hypothetical protein
MPTMDTLLRAIIRRGSQWFIETNNRTRKSRAGPAKWRKDGLGTWKEGDGRMPGR